jgi:hypothetical protein
VVGLTGDEVVSAATPTSAAFNRFLLDEVAAGLPIVSQDGDACTTSTGRDRHRCGSPFAHLPVHKQVSRRGSGSHHGVGDEAVTATASTNITNS